MKILQEKLAWRQPGGSQEMEINFWLLNPRVAVSLDSARYTGPVLSDLQGNEITLLISHAVSP